MTGTPQGCGPISALVHIPISLSILFVRDLSGNGAALFPFMTFLFLAPAFSFLSLACSFTFGSCQWIASLNVFLFSFSRRWVACSCSCRRRVVQRLFPRSGGSLGDENGRHLASRFFFLRCHFCLFVPLKANVTAWSFVCLSCCPRLPRCPTGFRVEIWEPVIIFADGCGRVLRNNNLSVLAVAPRLAIRVLGGRAAQTNGVYLRPRCNEVCGTGS